MASLPSYGTLVSLTALSGLGVYGGTYLYNNSKSKESDNSSGSIQPDSVFLFKKDVELPTQYKGKLLDLFKKDNLAFLVVFDADINKSWWEWSFNNKYLAKKQDTNKLHTLFRDIEIAFYDNTTNKSLNKACDDAYQQDASSYDIEDQSHLLENIADFCVAGNRVLDLKEPEGHAFGVVQTGAYSEGVLSVGSNVSHLVNPSKLDKHNNIWWNWAFKYFYKPNENTAGNDLFKNLTSGFSENPNNQKEVALNQACDAAYKKNKTDLEDNDSALLKDIAKFCSKTQQALLLPNLDIPESEPQDITTHQGTTTNDGEYKTKYLDLTKEDNKQHLVKGSDRAKNEKWWNWAFKNKYQPKSGTADAIDSIFTGITIGYHDTNTKSLNNACETAYKTDKANYSFDASKHLLKNIKDFCTKTKEGHDVSEPKATVYASVKTDETYKNGVLSKQENLQYLVDKDGATNNNDLWWKWAFKNLYEPNKTDASAVFNGLNEGYGATPKSSGETALNQACDAAYKKTRDDIDEDNKLLEGIKKFCSTKAPSSITSPNEPQVESQGEESKLKVFSSSDLNGYDNTKILGNVKDSNLSYFVKPTEDNKSWWRWSHQKRWENQKGSQNLHETFKGLIFGYHKTEEKSLNKACEKAYGLAKNDNYKFGDKDYLLPNIKQFCLKSTASNDLKVFEPKVTTYTSDPGTDYKYGVLSVEKNRSKIVQDIEGNKLWWEWAFKNVFEKEVSKSDYFKDAKDYSTSVDKALNKICAAAYKKPYTSLNAGSPKLLDDIKKFCSTGITQENTLTLPSEEPKTSDYLKDASNYSTFYKSAFAKNTKNNFKLIDPDKSQDWWNWMFANYYPTDNTTEKEKLQDPFNNVTKGFNSTSDDNKSLNQACKSAYEKDKNTIGNEVSKKTKLLESIKSLCVDSKNRSGSLENPDANQ